MDHTVLPAITPTHPIMVVASHHVPNIGNAITPLTMGPIGTTLGWSRPSNTSAAKPFPWYLVVTATCTVNVLVLWGGEIKNIHNFHETWMTVPLWYKKIQEAQLSLTNRMMLVCTVVEVWQDLLSEFVSSLNCFRNSLNKVDLSSYLVLS